MMIKKQRKPLINTVNIIVKQMDKVTLEETRLALVQTIALSRMKKSQLPPLYLMGGTAMGGLEALPQAPAPYLSQEMPEGKSLTLVLDLDETLVHYIEIPGTDGKYLTRPGTHEFLKRMAQCYELVIFTAAMQDYADWVLNDLDQEGLISHRLYR